jgi:hypothetical protein
MDYHTGTDIECRDDSTGTVVFLITIPELTSRIVITILVLQFFCITIPEMMSYIAMTVSVL